MKPIIIQYLEIVRPMYLEFVEPSKRYADIIIPERGVNITAIDMVVARVEAMGGGGQERTLPSTRLRSTLDACEYSGIERWRLRIHLGS